MADGREKGHASITANTIRGDDVKNKNNTKAAVRAAPTYPC